MAYARFEAGDDVYIWLGDGWIVCQLCKLSRSGLGEYDATTCDDMIAHVGLHLAAGHKVRASVVKELREERDDGLDAELEKNRAKYTKGA